MSDQSSTDQSPEEQYAEYLSGVLNASFSYRDWYSQQFGVELPVGALIGPQPIMEAVVDVMRKKLN